MNVHVHVPVTGKNAFTVTPELRSAMQKFVEECTWGVSAAVTQDMVDRFTALTGDRDPRHRSGAPGGAVAPEFLALSLLPQLTDLVGTRRVARTTLSNNGTDCRFERPVPVGSSIRLLKPSLDHFSIDSRGISAVVFFTIVLDATEKSVARGTIRLRLAPSRSR